MPDGRIKGTRITRRTPTRWIAPTLLTAALLGGCAKSVDNQSNQTAAADATNVVAVETVEDRDSAPPPTMPATMPPGLPTHAWVGRWTGPEGLFLDIQASPDGKAGHYAITNRDSLDRQGDYQGIADGATIRFVRDGADQTIRPGTGQDTGFKYLAGKQDCLIVVPGAEGYCR